MVTFPSLVAKVEQPDAISCPLREPLERIMLKTGHVWINFSSLLCRFGLLFWESCSWNVFVIAGFGLRWWWWGCICKLMVSGLCKCGRRYVKGLVEVVIRDTGITGDHGLIWQWPQTATDSWNLYKDVVDKSLWYDDCQAEQDVAMDFL